jgi:hypothetical protein
MVDADVEALVFFRDEYPRLVPMLHALLAGASPSTRLVSR